MERLMTAKKGYNNLWITKLNTLWYIVFNHFFINLVFFFNLMTFLLKDTYNTKLKERYGDNP